METSTIQFEKKGAIGILTLNRPECLNAVNNVMRDELYACLQERVDDLDTRVLVLTGMGRGFCSGMDIRDPSFIASGYESKGAYEAQRSFSELILLMRRCPQPIIGAINGVACGAGFSFAMACDIRMAAPKSRFQATYINLGFGGADMGSSWFLPRIVGLGNAARYILTGDFFSADEAHRMGLVQDVVEPEELLAAAEKMAKNLASKSPLGLRLTKEALNANASGASLEDAIRLEDRNQALCITKLTSGSRPKG